MNWRDYLKSIGTSDEEISKLVAAFPEDKLAKAFEQPIRDKVAAEAAAATAKREKEEFEKFYNDDVLPRVSNTFQDAINWRTRATAAEERLKAAKEYGFLADEGALPTIPGTTPGAPVGSGGVPGSPAVPASVAASLDPRYVSTADFKTGVDSIPEMLGRLTNMSNDHFRLFGEPLPDATELINQARSSKRNVMDVWKEKYNVEAKRKEIADKKQADHDRQISEEAVRKYLSEHGQPFTMPARPSLASAFTPKNVEDARHPWKNAQDRRQERKQALLDASAKAGAAAVTTRVQ